MSKIIYTHETRIAIIHPTGELPIEQVFQKDVPDQYKATAYIVDDDVIPSDRTYRDAWQHDITENENGLSHAISENLDKAKEIHKTRLRTERKVLLEDLDAQEMIATRKKEDLTLIYKEKERLCDITKLVDKCQNTQQLRLININTTEEEVDKFLIPLTTKEEVIADADI